MKEKIFPKSFSSVKAKTGLFQLGKTPEMIESMSVGCLLSPSRLEGKLLLAGLGRWQARGRAGRAGAVGRAVGCDRWLGRVNEVLQSDPDLSHCSKRRNLLW